MRPLYLLLLLTFIACSSQESVDDQAVVARVGERAITVRDFRIGYELAPANAKLATQDVAARKQAFLESTIETKLLAVAGLEAGLDQRDDVQRVLRWHEQQAVIQTLYREVVRDEIDVSEDEVRAAFVLLNQRLFLRQLLFRSEAEAQAAFRRVQQGVAFEDLALERARSEGELQQILSPKEFRWGDLDERLETAAYGLNHREVSAPTKSNVGVHLIQLVDRKENLIHTETAFEARRNYIETIIRRRKEATHARQYLANLAADQHPRIRGPVLKALVQRAQEAVSRRGEESPLPPFQHIHAVRPRLSDLMDQELVVFTGGAWTVRAFFDRIEAMPPASRPALTNPGPLTMRIAEMVRDDYLMQEGYRRQLEQDAAVQEEVARIREEAVSTLMRRALLDTVQVSEADARAFYEANRMRYQIPSTVNIREVMVRDRQRADSLYQAIQNGADLATLARAHSVRRWAAERDGELGYFAAGAFGTIGEQAFTMAVGELAGPVPVKLDTVTVGYSVFRLRDRQPATVPALEEIHDTVLADAQKARQREVLKGFLEEVKTRHPVSINEELLAAIETLDATARGRPMDVIMTRRR